MRLFITKILAVTMALATVLVADGVMLGTIPLLAGFLLLPAFALSSLRMFHIALRKPAKHRRAVAARQAMATSLLRVATGGRNPGGPRAA